MAFQPNEDRKLYQAVSIVKKYGGMKSTPWSVVRQVLPERKESSLKKRFEFLEAKIKPTITRFLNVFERRYLEAQQRGEVNPICSGTSVDLAYYLDWYKNSGYEAEEESTELPR